MGLLILMLIAVLGLIYSLTRFGFECISDGLEIFLGISCGLILAISLIVSPILYFGNLSDLADMEAFYLANAEVYSQTADETTKVLSEADVLVVDKALIPIEGSIEKFNVDTATTERIKEYRDMVTLYNMTLFNMKKFDKNWFVGVFFPTPDEFLKPIVLE